MKITSDHDAIFWLIRAVEGLSISIERDQMRTYRSDSSQLVRLRSVREEIDALGEYGKSIVPYQKLPISVIRAEDV